MDGEVEFGWIEVKGLGVDVHEDRGGAEEADDLGGGDEGEGGGEDGVAGADPVGHEGQEQGVRARGTADSVLGAHVGGESVFQFLDFGAHDVVSVGQDRLDAGVELGFNALLLSGEIYEVQNGSFQVKKKAKTFLARMSRMDTERPDDRGQMTDDGNYNSLLKKSGTRFLETGCPPGGDFSDDR